MVAREGFPCPLPLAGAGTLSGGYVISAEQWCPGGEVLRGDNAGTARSSAALLAGLMAIMQAQPLADLGPAASVGPLESAWTRPVAAGRGG